MSSFGQGSGWRRPNAEKTGWETILEKVQIVVKVFEHTASGVGSTAIVRIANKERWPVPGRADDWHKTLPRKLIHNRRVLGEFEPAIKEGSKWRVTGEFWANYYPAVVPVGLFNAAQASAARRRNVPSRRDVGYHNVLQGFLRCGHCGTTLARKPKNSNRNSPGYALYGCADRVRGLTQCPNWNAKALEATGSPMLSAYCCSRWRRMSCSRTRCIRAARPCAHDGHGYQRRKRTYSRALSARLALQGGAHRPIDPVRVPGA